MLAEVQALVTRTSFGIPRRQATGCDIGRTNLLMAVLEKRMHLPLGECDAYINIAGGMRMNEPAVDLAIVAAAISSYKDKVIPKDLVVFGEVGLAGEVRNVAFAENRANEAAKLGFTRIMMPRDCAASIRKIEGADIIAVSSLSDVIKVIS